MPDRYGEPVELDSGGAAFACEPGYVAAHQAAIDACALCDDNGTRNGGFACDHTDHAAASARVMDMFRQTMGWPTP